MDECKLEYEVGDFLDDLPNGSYYLYRCVSFDKTVLRTLSVGRFNNHPGLWITKDKICIDRLCAWFKEGCKVTTECPSNSTETSEEMSKLIRLLHAGKEIKIRKSDDGIRINNTVLTDYSLQGIQEIISSGG